MLQYHCKQKEALLVSELPYISFHLKHGNLLITKFQPLESQTRAAICLLSALSINLIKLLIIYNITIFSDY